MRADISGDDVLICQEIECLWNISQTVGEQNFFDDVESIGGQMGDISICNYDSRAIILGLPVPANCPHKSEVYKFIRAKAMIEPGQATEMIKRVNEYIESRAKEARARLGLSTISSK